MFENAYFIKPPLPFDREDKKNCYAPIFRKTFTLGPVEAKAKAIISYCALGFGHITLNGERIEREVFGTAESVYHKTVWYNTADVTGKLREGENVICALCGNGFFNEIFRTPWDFNKARWRDHPKFIAELNVGGKTALRTGDGWKCSVRGPITYNQIRGGERYDARLRDDGVCFVGYDDSAWEYAAVDGNPPGGVFRENFISPVLEFGEFTTEKIIKTSEGRYVYDFGVNMSGYARLDVRGEAGDEIVLRYGEDFKDGQIFGPRADGFYPDSEYYTDRFICSGGRDVWSPSFSYHGFRYIEAEGLPSPEKASLKAVFIHQDIKRTGYFMCSDERLNRLFEIGVQACYSNFVLKPTDCPTREKMGWANDLQASADQMLLNFDIADYFKKFIHDTADCMREDGMLPGIIPTDAWGYGWGNGPVSEGVLFELCYQIYLHTGDSAPLIEYLPYFLRSLENFRSHEDGSGFCAYGLTDWAPPVSSEIPVQFINGALFIHFLRITKLAAELAGNIEKASALGIESRKYRERFIASYIKEDGSCIYDTMTAPAMAIYYSLYNRDMEPLKKQLARLIEEKNFHHDCGMVGLRRLYGALDKCGLQSYAYKIITAEGFPGYFNWLEGGATTLWEKWDCGDSHNHHMYSSFMAWLIGTLAGIAPDPSFPGYGRIVIRPYFATELDFCEASADTVKGRISVRWERAGADIALRFTIPEGCEAIYDGTVYGKGEHSIKFKENS